MSYEAKQTSILPIEGSWKRQEKPVIDAPRQRNFAAPNKEMATKGSEEIRQLNRFDTLVHECCCKLASVGLSQIRVLTEFRNATEV